MMTQGVVGAVYNRIMFLTQAVDDERDLTIFQQTLFMSVFSGFAQPRQINVQQPLGYLTETMENLIIFSFQVIMITFMFFCSHSVACSLFLFCECVILASIHVLFAYYIFMFCDYPIYHLHISSKIKQAKKFFNLTRSRYYFSIA